MPRSRAIREREARASQGSARRREIGSPKQLLLVIREKDDLAVSIRPRRIYSFRSYLYYGRDIHQPCAEYGGHSKSRRCGGRNDSRFSRRVSARDAKGILVKIVNLTCPGCGARLEVDMDRKMAFCSYCGAALPVDDEIQKVQLDGAEKAGYEFEKGRQGLKRKRRRHLFRLSKPAINQPPSQLSSPKSLPNPSRPLKSPRRGAKRGCGFWGGSAFSPFRSQLSC